MENVSHILKRVLTLVALSLIARTCTAMIRPVGFWRAHENRVISMSLDMLLQVLRSFEGFAAKVAFVRLEWNMHANVRSDVITLDGGGTAVPPLAGEVQIVGALSTDMTLANMVLNCSLEVVLVICFDDRWNRNDVRRG